MYDLAEHRHRFAVWAAARAAQRGFTTVKELRRALEQVPNIRKIALSPHRRSVTAAQFDALHREWCSSICRSLKKRSISNVTYGRAAKLVAVYLKALILMGDAWDSPLGRTMHPPIDRILLQALAQSKILASPALPAWRSINWTRLDEPEYFQLIDQLRAAIPMGAPFWTIEEYWQPSDSADTA